MGMEGEHVWAAQYRLLDAKYISASSSVRKDEVVATMSLYKDILSVRNRRTASQIARDAVDVDVELGLEPLVDTADVVVNRTAEVVALVPEGHNEANTAEEDEGEDEQSFEEYEKRLEEAIRMFEAAPPRFLER